MIKTVFLLLLLLNSLPLFGQLLWEISGNGLEKKSFLFATIQSADSRVMALTEKAKPVFERADILVTEFSAKEEFRPLMMNYIFMGGDSSLADLLPPEHYKLLQEILSEKMGQVLPFAERIRPVFLAMLLQEGNNLPADQPSANQYFQLHAKEQQKRIYSLEDFEGQLSRILTLSMEWQLAELTKMLSDDLQRQSESMIDLYLAENLRAIEADTHAHLPEEIGKIMVTDHNKTLAARLLGLLRDRNSFFATISASKFLGKDGIIVLLKKEGYSVTPVLR